MSVGAVVRRVALAALAGSGCGIASAADDGVGTTTLQTRAERNDNRGVSEFSLGRWTNTGRADIGWGVGQVNLIERPEISAPTLMLGLRYRSSERASFYADATHVRGIGPNGEDEVVSKVGIELKVAKSRWNLTYGGLGMHLGGDSRMTLKARRGGLELVLRRSF